MGREIWLGLGADRAAQLWGHDSVPIFTRQDLETRHEAPCKLIEMRSGDAVHTFIRTSKANLWAILAFRVGYAIRTGRRDRAASLVVVLEAEVRGEERHAHQREHEDCQSQDHNER